MSNKSFIEHYEQADELACVEIPEPYKCWTMFYNIFEEVVVKDITVIQEFIEAYKDVMDQRYIETKKLNKTFEELINYSNMKEDLKVSN